MLGGGGAGKDRGSRISQAVVSQGRSELKVPESRLGNRNIGSIGRG